LTFLRRIYNEDREKRVDKMIKEMNNLKIKASVYISVLNSVGYSVRNSVGYSVRNSVGYSVRNKQYKVNKGAVLRGLRDE
jgi:hypothetical protein